MIEVYVVLEEDRGLGVSVIGVYADFEDAREKVAESSHYYYERSELSQ